MSLQGDSVVMLLGYLTRTPEGYLLGTQEGTYWVSSWKPSSPRNPIRIHKQVRGEGCCLINRTHRFRFSRFFASLDSISLPPPSSQR